MSDHDFDTEENTTVKLRQHIDAMAIFADVVHEQLDWMSNTFSSGILSLPPEDARQFVRIRARLIGVAHIIDQHIDSLQPHISDQSMDSESPVDDECPTETEYDVQRALDESIKSLVWLKYIASRNRM